MRAVAMLLSLVVAFSPPIFSKSPTNWVSPPTGMAHGSQCPECSQGEWRLVISRDIDVGDYVYEENPPCDDESMGEQRHEIARALADDAEPGLGEAAGPLIDAVSDAAGQFFRDNVRGTLGQYLATYTNPIAQCEILSAIVPKDSQITGVKYWAADGIDPNEKTCDPAPDGEIYCGIGWSRFDPAYIESQRGGKAVCATFANWSADRIRTATMGVYFIPVQGKEPIPIHR